MRWKQLPGFPPQPQTFTAGGNLLTEGHPAARQIEDRLKLAPPVVPRCDTNLPHLKSHTRAASHQHPACSCVCLFPRRPGCVISCTLEASPRLLSPRQTLPLRGHGPGGRTEGQRRSSHRDFWKFQSDSVGFVSDCQREIYIYTHR